MTNFKELQQKYEFDVFPKRDLCIVKGKGAKLWDDQGNEYIDMASGISVANIGHANEKIVEALKNQAEKLITCPGTFYNDTKALFLEKLISVAPANLTKAYLCNSGTEAMEAAIKFSRYFTKRTDFISAMKGFHGRTLGALSATYKKDYREDFEPLVPGFSFVPYNNIEKLREAITPKTAGIILEPIQGEGGINIADKEYLKAVQQLCNENGIMFIIDEIQSAFCRTGKMFATEHFDIEPDMITAAKSIAGGFPMGAVLLSDKYSIPPGKHGTTFGGNPLACAAGIASIDFMIENDLCSQSIDKGEHFVNLLNQAELTKVSEIRSLGLMIGIELKENVQPLLQELMDHKIIGLPAGTTVLRLLPPIVISKDDLTKVAEVLIKLLK